MTVRENIEKIEEQILSPYAVLSKNSKGRQTFEEKCSIRTEFQRDRDRIIHSKSFRRLKHKTQVFITPEGDHYRTRLTHTLEVSQIARTIARGLKLNEDLAEAIALSHDLGHTPFGHSGEHILNEICPYGFKHYEQSLRVVDFLEGGKGLNLTSEVRDGIVNHTGENLANTLEGIIIKFADRIAYINHDIDDAIRGNVISQNSIPNDCIKILGDTHSKRINTMICDLINESMGKNEIKMSDEVLNATLKLRKFMFENVYIGSNAKTEEAKAQQIIERLYKYFVENSDKLPEEYNKLLKNNDIHRVVCDYIAGMTDRYALFSFKEIFIPKSWNIE